MAYLEDIIVYLDKIGFFSIMLPFILIFSIVYAILEKTKILGTEKVGKEELPKRNVNLIVAFSVALLAVASSQATSIITIALPHIVILIFVAVFSMVFLGIFGQESDWKKNKAVKYYSGAMIIALLLIFLNAIDWLDEIIDYFESNTNISNLIGVIILFGVIALVILWITQPEEKSGKNKDEDES